MLVFNGRDGEFAAALDLARKHPALSICERLRPQEVPPDVDYMFAPLKHARLDYMAQKAVVQASGTGLYRIAGRGGGSA